ncbi:thioredoxin family protein [Winogradskyella sp.]|uniref:thioredoxin family protein n=1 Tax=Winogradskyella sp. TaxID=1883156 RepID=UPI001B1F00B4|nr:thioredoxin family protein [Winogradskyella sp.]MBO6881232.1 thioredoxin family protein [Winogradskyella sp.]
MKVNELSVVNEIISKSLKKSISYPQYRALVAELVQKRSTTGNEKTEALINYTMLNDRRMKRWDKTVKISDAAKTIIQNFNKKVTWLVITESWCGDAAHIMPIIHKVAELNDNIDYRIVMRDDNVELMDLFLTNGARGIPKLIMIDNESKEVVNTFGARPSVATEMVQAYKKEHGMLTPEFKEDLQRWYNNDKGQSTIEDLLRLLT